MLHITKIDEGIEIYKALGSDIRVQIIKLLIQNNGMNMNELANKLNITNGALTSHIKKLEDCGIIKIDTESTGHGNQKRCLVNIDKILIDFCTETAQKEVYETDVRIGHFSDYQVWPTCGLATTEHLVGEVDDPRYFAHSSHVDASILWFSKGYIEYIIPNFLPPMQKIHQILISAELSSEAPGVNNVWPSDISFYINDICLGSWTSPGDYGDVKGCLTPDWWYSHWNQYGLLKTLDINPKGAFMDGTRLSYVTTKDLNLDYRSKIKFKMAVPDTAEHVGGLTVFGRNFGNYNQDIKVKIIYTPYED